MVTLTATANAGYTFSEWTGDHTGSANPVRITVNGNKTIAAHFTQDEYTLTITHTGNGAVTPGSSGPHHYGDVVQLTAVPDSGESFVGWSGDLTGSGNPKSITMNGNRSVKAIFTQGGVVVVPCQVSALVEAIRVANGNSQPTSISLAANCDYILVEPAETNPADNKGPVGLPYITANITIIGNNARIARAEATTFRMFAVSSSGSLTLRNVSIGDILPVTG